MGFMFFRKFVKYFDKGNVSVCGLRGDGKDMLMANVVVRRKKAYISNIDYGGQRCPFIYELLNCGKNNYQNFLSGKIKKYIYPYADETDIYISDAGVYFPAQYNDKLNREYPEFPTFMALSRQIGKCNVHYNSQALNRVWDKIREQSDIYIRCRGCIVIFGIVFLHGRIYEKYESAVNNVRPFKLHDPNGILASREAHEQFRMHKEMKEADYYNTHGEIVPFFTIFRNKSVYDTRLFKKILAEGEEE